MNERSFHNWQTKSGVYDALNLSYVDFDEDYPVLSSIQDLTNFNVVSCNNYKGMTGDSLVSTFVYDSILERFWNNPMKYVDIFNKVKYVLSPDFSLLIGMPRPVQQWNVYRNRLIGYIWQRAGINIIPTISWSDDSSFEFCFRGVGLSSIVAVSNIGCRNEKQKEYFDNGFNEMIRQISPSKIIFQCNKKYKESYQRPEIIFIDSYWDKKRKDNGG
jgi:hypothetical protein